MGGMSTISLTIAALVVAVAGAATVGTASAAGGWLLPATTLAPKSDGVSGPVVGIDAAGNSIAVWTSGPTGSQSVLASTRPADGVWSAPVVVSESAEAISPSLAVDSAGNATALWTASVDSTTYLPRVARLDASSGTWSAPHDFATVADAGAATAQLQANDAGDAVAAWLEFDEVSGNYLVRAAQSAAGGGWSTPVTLSDPGDFSAQSSAPQVALRGAGRAVVAWTADHHANSTFHVQESRLAGGSWTAARDIVSSPSYITSLKMAGDGTGDVVATWTTDLPWILQSARLTNGGWSIADVSSDVSTTCVPPTAIDFDATGTTAIWNPASTGGLSAATLGAEGWSVPVPFFTPSSSDEFVDGLDFDQTGSASATAAWSIYDSADDSYAVLAATRRGASWSNPLQLATAAADDNLGVPEVAMSASGAAVAGWMAFDALWRGAARVAVDSVGSPGNAGSVTPRPTGGVLSSPFLKVRGGVLRLRRGSRTVRAPLRNRDSVALRGTARLARFDSASKQGKPVRTIVVQRGLRLRSKGRTSLRLRLDDRALRRLRRAPRHSYPVRIHLDLRAADGRAVESVATYTLDGRGRFGAGRAPADPFARKSC